MKSHEIIREAVDEPGVKAVAAALKVSAALVYKWCEPTPEGAGGQGARLRVFSDMREGRLARSSVSNLLISRYEHD